jgi:SpoVK/Ycf46/Vps4 family AAA+-type ATPase
MPTAAHSAYIRYHQKSAMIRRWIAIILLRSDLESYVPFAGIEPMITRGFDTSALNKDNREDPAFIRGWLKDELRACGNDAIDESDVFAINTRRIRKSMGLNKVELAILRFACLVNGYKPLEAATEFGGNCLAEADLCDLLSQCLRVRFSRVYRALRPNGMLRQSGLVGCGDWTGTQHVTRWLRVPGMLAREVFRPQDDDNLLINVFYTTGPKSTLTQHDFPQRSEINLLQKYLRASIREKAAGANVLLWGRPGTGKTELARYLAQSLRKKSLEINTVDFENRALTAADRLDCYRFCQAVLARGSNAIVTFDEVEEILCDQSFSRFGFREKGQFTKGLLNNILESNTTPAIWITNTVDGIDPAYLRRFDMVMELRTPMASVKKKIAFKAFKDLPMQKTVIDRMVQHDRITPAHMSKVTRICERIGVKTPEEGGLIARKVLNGDLRAVRARPLEGSAKKSEKKRVELPYRVDLINCDTHIADLTGTLDADASVRICAFGPPGTGKSAWARHLAETLKRPLLVKRAADILDKFVGETEKNIANTFEEAMNTGSILMLDEMDSFLPDRRNATRHWEVSQANQFLVAMEEFDGILLCSTNLRENLDPATMRRFDFKITFDYLEADQACELALDLMDVLKVKLGKEERSQLRAALASTRLAHGDFAALLRRYSALKSRPTWLQLVTDLKTEMGFREEERRPIGFLSEISA